MCAYDDKRYLLADGVNSLAYGHHAVPAVVHNVEPVDFEWPTDRVLTAAEAHHRRIPLRKRTFPPVGQDPRACFGEASRLRNATLRDGELGPVVELASTSTSSTSALGTQSAHSPHSHTLDAVPTEKLLEYIVDDDDCI